MRLLVCGGRSYDNYALVEEKIVERKPDVIIHGGCSGADAMARAVSSNQGIPEICMPAKFNFYGRAGGPMRNQWMIDFLSPTFCLAFPGNAGTADMIERCKKAGIPGVMVAEPVEAEDTIGCLSCDGSGYIGMMGSDNTDLFDVMCDDCGGSGVSTGADR